MGLNVLPKLLNVMSDNGSNVTTAMKHMFQLINVAVGYEQMCPCNHVSCADHSIQLVVLKVLVRIKDINAWLRRALVYIRRIREAFHLRTGYRGHIPKLVATEADRSCGDGPDHKSDSLSDSTLVLEHCCHPTPRPDRVDTFFTTMLEQVQNVGDEIDDEVEKYLNLGVVTSLLFIDMMEWWMVQKDMFPTHYQMATDYLGTLAMSTPSQRVNNMAGCEFTVMRQSLSSSVFIYTMCLCSWINAGVIKVPLNRAKVAADIEKAFGDGATASVVAIFDQIAVE
ncbi:unnamed protein product [Sphagnum troendelagicum]